MAASTSIQTFVSRAERTSSIRVFHLQNVVAPYVLPLFDALAREWDFRVYYCKRRTALRMWDTRLDGCKFRASILPHADLGPLVLNFTLAKELFFGPAYDVYMFAENLPNVLSILLVLAMARLQRKPIVMWTAVIETIWDIARKSQIRRWFERRFRGFLCKHIDVAVALSEPARVVLQRYGLAADRIYRTAYFVDPPHSLGNKERAKQQLDLDGKAILSVGYLVERKAFDVLIRAFQQLGLPNTTLLIAGTGPALQGLQSLVRSFDRIRFVGHIEGTTKDLYYGAADVFVLPSLHDDWGLVINEAMSYGLPVIATSAVAATHDLVRENGIVVPAGDVRALAMALAQLLGDAFSRQAMSSASLAINREFDLEYARKGFISAVDRALEVFGRV